MLGFFLTENLVYIEIHTQLRMVYYGLLVFRCG